MSIDLELMMTRTTVLQDDHHLVLMMVRTTRIIRTRVTTHMELMMTRNTAE